MYGFPPGTRIVKAKFSGRPTSYEINSLVGTPERGSKALLVSEVEPNTAFLCIGTSSGWRTTLVNRAPDEYLHHPKLTKYLGENYIDLVENIFYDGQVIATTRGSWNGDISNHDYFYATSPVYDFGAVVNVTRWEANIQVGKTLNHRYYMLRIYGANEPQPESWTYITGYYSGHLDDYDAHRSIGISYDFDVNYRYINFRLLGRMLSERYENGSAFIQYMAFDYNINGKFYEKVEPIYGGHSGDWVPNTYWPSHNF